MCPKSNYDGPHSNAACRRRNTIIGQYRTHFFWRDKSTDIPFSTEALKKVPPSDLLSQKSIETFKLSFHLHSKRRRMMDATNHSISVLAPESENSEKFSVRSRPVEKLTESLINTYKHINKLYYAAKAKAQRDCGKNAHTDLQGNYIGQHGSFIGNDRRYIVKQKLGSGSFGVVVEAFDTQTETDVAIKVVRARSGFTIQAQSEIALLKLVKRQDPTGSGHVVSMLDHFQWQGHQCIVFELLTMNLFQVLQHTKGQGLSLNLTRKIAKQLLETLQVLGRRDIDVVHCDLKPENIALVRSGHAALKVLDLGSSCRNTEKAFTYIQSRFYRSPEILLGLPYDQRIDMWSLGCILAELHTGNPLFFGYDSPSQLTAIVNRMGMVPSAMLARTSPATRDLYFIQETNTGNNLSNEQVTYKLKPKLKIHRPKPLKPYSTLWKEQSSKLNDGSDASPMASLKASLFEEKSRQTLSEFIGMQSGGPGGLRAGEKGHSTEDYLLFLDLLQRMLAYDPVDRISAADALAHHFIMKHPL